MIRSLPLLVVLAVGCAGPDDEAEPADEVGEPTVLVARKVAFAREEDGVSEGFDLDGVTTGPGDASGCGIPDFVSPAGEPGIDNSLSGLLPIVELTGGQALPELVQNAVFQGELLLLFQVGPDDGEGCVPIDIVRGAEPPALGTDGQVLPGQTFAVDHAQPTGHVACAQSAGGDALRGGGLELRLPLHVFDETIDLTLRGGVVEVTPNDDDTWRIVVAGGISVQELTDNVLGFDAIPESLVSAVTGALASRGDLDGPEGPCSAMSSALVMEAVPAFLFPDDLEAGLDPQPDPG